MCFGVGGEDTFDQGITSLMNGKISRIQVSTGGANQMNGLVNTQGVFHSNGLLNLSPDPYENT
jgi:hypothetical protein